MTNANEPTLGRCDFLMVFDVRDGNPNGDPDAGNLPRMDPETGRGLITDVCLKRKVRNYVLLAKEGQAGYDIYVKERAVLGRAHTEAYQRLGISVGEGASVILPDEEALSFEGLELPEGLSLDEQDDGRRILAVAADADKAEIKTWLKEATPNKIVKDVVTRLLKGSTSRRPTREQVDSGRVEMCRTYYDIRAFGAVLSLKSAPSCGQVRGPVQFTFARSVDPIVPLEHSITRMAVATEQEAEKQGGDNRTMGRKATIPYGLYVGYGFVSPSLAQQTGFSQEDLELLWHALSGMFELDRSAARGLMTMRRLFVFEHESHLGNASAASLFEKIVIQRRDGVEIPRSFSDYQVTVVGDMPSGVTLHEKSAVGLALV